jgi:hypothetical protein
MTGRILLGGLLVAALLAIGCPPAGTTSGPPSSKADDTGSTKTTNKTPHIPSGPND